MESTSQNVHHCKLQLQNVLKNLEKLEQAQKSQLHLEPIEINNLISNTTDILAHLEQQPTHKIKQFLEKRQRKRQKAKLTKRKLKLCKDESSKVISTQQKVPTQQMLPNICNNSRTSLKPAQKPHQQLRSFRDANRFLKTFELLELLHSARSQDEASTREFASKLAKLRKVWNVIRFENKPDFTAAGDVQHQWNAVLFGSNEKSFYKQKRSVVDLIKIRRTWDSYITSDAKVGSTIPASWVLPPENADERWGRYKIQ